MPPQNFNSVPLVPKIPVYSPTHSNLNVPVQNVSLVIPVTPKEDYPRISRILTTRTATNATTAFYTVPVDKVFLLISCGMSVVVDAAAGSQAKLYGGSSSEELLEFNSYAAASDAGIYQMNADFSIPIIYKAGEVFTIKSQSNSIHATAMIRGYEMDSFSAKSQVKIDELMLFRGFLNVFK